MKYFFGTLLLVSMIIPRVTFSGGEEERRLALPSSLPMPRPLAHIQELRPVGSSMRQSASNQLNRPSSSAIPESSSQKKCEDCGMYTRLGLSFVSVLAGISLLALSSGSVNATCACGCCLMMGGMAGQAASASHDNRKVRLELLRAGARQGVIMRQRGIIMD